METAALLEHAALQSGEWVTKQAAQEMSPQQRQLLAAVGGAEAALVLRCSAVARSRAVRASRGRRGVEKHIDQRFTRALKR